MKRQALTTLCLLIFWTAAGGQQQALRVASDLEIHGQFKEAASTLTAALKETSLTAAEQKRLEFELDRLERIKGDFPLSSEALFQQLQKSVKGLNHDEYAQWVQEGRFDSREIDGRRWFMVSSVKNLFWRNAELSSRRLPPEDKRTIEKHAWETCVEIKKAARAEHKRYVLPKRFEVTMTVTADANAAPAGEIVKAWIPIPREYPFQGEFTLKSSSVTIKHLDTKECPIRCAYLEQRAKKDAPTCFKIDYEYTAQGIWFDVDPRQVTPADTNNPNLAPFTREGPHIVFTPEMRALSETIAGGEPNPYLKAKKFHDWISEHIQYSYAIEYSTIRNIGEYCRSHGYGDCGQEALLFMTLCRLNGIPARWQSGWHRNTLRDEISNHDWSEIYIAPYGWMPVDPYMGIYVMQYANSLTPQQKREVRDFYFGGLDPYRMIANSDHNQTLTPPKQSMRSDDVDFQRGELEWGDHNIYFDKYSYDLTLKEVKRRRERVE